MIFLTIQVVPVLLPVAIRKGTIVGLDSIGQKRPRR
jgi:hypothetical protein